MVFLLAIKFMEIFRVHSNKPLTSKSSRIMTVGKAVLDLIKAIAVGPNKIKVSPMVINTAMQQR